VHHFKQYLIISLSLSLTFNALAQSSKTLHFPTVGWSISIPAFFTIEDSATIKARNDSFLKRIKANTGRTPDFGSKTTLFIAKNYNNSIIGNIEPFKGKPNNWQTTIANLNTALAKSYTLKDMPYRMDTASTVIFIDKLRFHKFSIILKDGKQVKYEAGYFARLINGYTLTINYTISFLATTTTDGIPEIINASKFSIR
jgi:hypothetical protein